MNNDLIRRKDVEKMLITLGGCDPVDVYAKGWDDAIDEALRKLSEIESADRWIPCSEKLPRDGRAVEVTDENGIRNVSYYLRGFWYDLNTNFPMFVEAWKEPSEPWKGEE